MARPTRILGALRNLGRVAIGVDFGDEWGLMTSAPARHSGHRTMPGILFDNVDSILDGFLDLEDPGSTINRGHLLGDLIVISIMAVIARADGPTAIGTWAAHHEAWLRKHLQLPNEIPSHDTFDRLLATLKPSAFQACFATWIASVVPSDDKPDLKQVAIDGKALRHSHDRRKGLGPLFLVSAWAVDRGIRLGQLATEEKYNEIAASPELLDQIAIEGAVVTIDAVGCQTEIAAKIIHLKGHYVLALKGNQGNLHKAVTE